MSINSDMRNFGEAARWDLPYEKINLGVLDLFTNHEDHAHQPGSGMD